MNKWLPLLPGVLALFAVSCVEAERPTGGDRIELMAEVGEIRYLTRGTPVESVHDAFSVWAWIWETERNTPNYLCGETFTRTGSSTWKSDFPHGKVLPGYQLQLWALGPAGAQGVSDFPKATSYGAPGFSFTTPSDVSAQTDLMAALSEVYDGTPSLLTLRFRHLLSCLQFRTTEDVPGDVVSVEVTDVCAEGSYREGEGWISVSDPQAFVADGLQDAFLLLPQTLGSEAKLRVTVEQGSVRQVLTASLADLPLPEGCRTEILLSFPSPGSLRLEVSVSPWTAGPEYLD